MKYLLASLAAAATVASASHADVLGWTANVRNASGGGTFIDVFLVANEGDALLNVYGGYPGASLIGWVSTTASGGFAQSTTEAQQLAWRPSTNQSWNSLDSFLTVGGGFNTTSGAWSGNSATVGDPLWTVGGIDTFSSAGYGNANNVPFTAGWYVAGSSSPARSLAGLNGRVANSSAAAAAGSFGMLVAHLYVTDAAPSVMLWNMQASVRRANGTISQDGGSMTVQVPAPGVLAVLALGGSLRGARRRR